MFRALFLKILDFLFPIECLSCGRENKWLCEECFKKLNFNQNYFINKNAFNHLDGVFIVFNYKNKLVEKLIKNYKYNFIKDIGPILAETACIFLKNRKEINLKNFTIIPVPLHPKRLAWRGFNQAQIIAEKIADKFNLKISLDLKKIKNSPPQAKFDREKRIINIINSFLWNQKTAPPKNILLIDDISTTGSTLDECASVLKKAGAKNVYGLVIAHG